MATLNHPRKAGARDGLCFRWAGSPWKRRKVRANANRHWAGDRRRAVPEPERGAVSKCPRPFEGGSSRRGVPAGHRAEPSADRGADAHDLASSLSFHCPVDGRAGDAEQVGELSGAVIAPFEQSHQVRYLSLIELGLLTAQTPFSLGDLHPLSGTQPNQVGLELGNLSL